MPKAPAPVAVAMTTTVKHDTAVLTVGTPDLAGSCYLVAPALAALFEGMGWAALAPDAADPVDMTHLVADPDTVRHSDGAVVVPASVTIKSA